ncbi:MAG: hypothetical protein V8T86_06425 [Victivallis sp.]
MTESNFRRNKDGIDPSKTQRRTGAPESVFASAGQSVGQSDDEKRVCRLDRHKPARRSGSYAKKAGSFWTDSENFKRSRPAHQKPRRWKSDRLKLPRLNSIRAGNADLSFAELKARKLEAEIRHLEQRTLDRQETIERNFEAEIIEKLIDALQPLKDAFVKCKLTPEQTSLITGALNESLQQLERSLIQ